MKLAIEHLKTQVEAAPVAESQAQADLDAARARHQAAIDAAHAEVKAAEANLAHVRHRNADFSELYEAAKLGKLQTPTPASDVPAEDAQ